MTYKIFATMQLVAIVILIGSLMWDYWNWTDVYSIDGGWTTHYKISKKIRKMRNLLIGLAGLISFISFILLIWLPI